MTKKEMFKELKTKEISYIKNLKMELIIEILHIF